MLTVCLSFFVSPLPKTQPEKFDPSPAKGSTAPNSCSQIRNWTISAGPIFTHHHRCFPSSGLSWTQWDHLAYELIALQACSGNKWDKVTRKFNTALQLWISRIFTAMLQWRSQTAYKCLFIFFHRQNWDIRTSFRCWKTEDGQKIAS